MPSFLCCIGKVGTRGAGELDRPVMGASAQAPMKSRPPVRRAQDAIHRADESAQDSVVRVSLTVGQTRWMAPPEVLTGPTGRRSRGTRSVLPCSRPGFLGSLR